ncbi:MAG: YifB family Mg chelatase-like AAA ATPase [Deltaproteobacteria bacterium]|nr:YifB family Mg chelatase-like AAA ATPase [Deltaproteobacteria bacterium]
MLARVHSGALVGIDAYPVEVEIDVYPGMPSITVVGLPDSAVKESTARVKSAIINSGYPFPARRITINLAPAGLKKEGAGFDLPIALGTLAALDLLPAEKLEDYLVVGEVSLDGAVKWVRGALSLAISARQQGFKGLILPEMNAREAAVVEGIDVFGVSSLLTATGFIMGRVPLQPRRLSSEEQPPDAGAYPIDFKEVRGQEYAKRAVEVAAAGGHNVLMIGPPGSGKTMISQRIPTILPEPVFEESIETTRIYSAAGLLGRNGAVMTVRPFRSPHHTVSDAGLIGGGIIPRPGEVSLAHNGVLFLDEFPEFKKNVLEVLRQPMEDGVVTISRSQMSVTFPARFMLVAAMNPCPCGYRGDPKHECKCGALAVQRYWSKISGPLLDRIDIHVEVPAVNWKDVTGKTEGEPSAPVQERVNRARRIQLERFRNAGIYSNAQMGARHLKRFCPLGQESLAVLEKAMDVLGLSARAYHRVLKIARTIADLEGSENVLTPHVTEAVQYRSLDRRYM